MVLETVIIAAISAYIRGGKLKNMSNVRFRYWYLVILGFFMQQIPGFLNNLGDGEFAKIAADTSFILVVTSYILIIIPLLFNLKINGIFFSLTGTILNAIVIIANNGMMPVTKNALVATGYDRSLEIGQKLDMIHYVANGSTRINLLSDFIPIPRPYPIPHVLSIGDVLLCIGLFLFIQYMFLKKDSDPPKVT